MSYPYCYSGLTLCFVAVFDDLMMKNIRKTGVGMSDWWLSEQVLAQWWHPVASSEALDPLHRAMHAVSYRRIAMAIETASFVGVFVDCCLFACCPGGCWGDTEQVVTRCRHPVASGVALGMLHQAMHFVLHRCTAMAMKMAGGQGALFLIVDFVINHNSS